jgi:hypothetical protein
MELLHGLYLLLRCICFCQILQVLTMLVKSAQHSMVKHAQQAITTVRHTPR